MEHRIQGQLDPPLSEEGERQAKRLGGRLARRSLAGIYSSDLKRAMQTAEVIGKLTGTQPVPMPSLREIFLGEWEGLRTDDLAGRFPEAWAGWTLLPDWDLVPGGERAAAFETRSWSAVETLFALHPEGGDVLAVTHGGVVQMALYRILGRPSRGVFAFRIQNASITIIEKRDGRIFIDGVNDVSHLEPVLASEAGPA